MPNKIKTEAFLVCSSSNSRKKIFDYRLLIETLAYSTLNTVEPPAGCAIVTISNKVQVHLLLKVIVEFCAYCIIFSFYLCHLCTFKGLIDPKKELEKLGKKEEQLADIIRKTKLAMEVPDYNVKVPLDVQNSNKEKLINSEGELQRVTDALLALRTM